MPLNKINLADYLSDVFIETGTHRGDGVRRALEAGFGYVMSCEPDLSMLGRMPQNLIDHEKTHIGIGSSTKWLPRFLDMATGIYRGVDVTFWLDAHPDGELLYATSPLGYELDIIDTFMGYLGKVNILIDDMRLFSEDDQDSIERFIQDMRGNVLISRVDGAVPNDILVGQM